MDNKPKLSKRQQAKLAEYLAIRAVNSDGHVCYIGTRDGGRESFRISDEADPDPSDVELFVDSSGTAMFRAPSTSIVQLPEEHVNKQTKGMNDEARKQWLTTAPSVCRRAFKFKGPVRVEGSVLICTGIANIEAVCEELRCRLPAATKQLKMQRDSEFAAAKEAHDIKIGRERKPKQTGESRVAKGTNGKHLIENWRELFIRNEAAAKKGKALTDEQLIAEMYEYHPDKNPCASIERCGSQRSAFNKGSYGFAQWGKPDKPSHRYLEDGKTPAPARKSKSESAPKKKSVAKKAAATTKKKSTAVKKKVVVKKTSKKSSH